MFFNSTKAIKKSKKLINKSRQKAAAKANNRSISTSATSSSATITTNRDIETKKCDVSVTSSITTDSSPLNSIRSPTTSSTTTKNLQVGTVPYAEHKARKTLTSIVTTISNLENREQTLETNIQNQIKEAKQYMCQNAKAIRCMKKIKIEQVEIEKVSSAIETLEAQRSHIESSLNSIQVLKVLQEGSESLVGLNPSNTKVVSDVDVVIDGIRNTMEITAEINDILSAPVDTSAFDDHDLLIELEKMVRENEGSSMDASLSIKESRQDTNAATESVALTRIDRCTASGSEKGYYESSEDILETIKLCGCL